MSENSEVRQFQVRQYRSKPRRLLAVTDICSSGTDAHILHHDSLKSNRELVSWLVKESRPFWLQPGTWLVLPGIGAAKVKTVELLACGIRMRLVDENEKFVMDLESEEVTQLGEKDAWTGKPAGVKQ